MCRSPSETVPSADRTRVGPRFHLSRVSGSSLPNPGIQKASDSLGRHQCRAHPALSTINIATGSQISGFFQPHLCLAARCELTFHRFHYRLFLSFESSVPCTNVFKLRVPRQWKPGLFSGSSRLRFASGSRSSPASTFVTCGSCASRGLSCLPQLVVAVGFFAFLLRETVL